jgi:hypothetical protein
MEVWESRISSVHAQMTAELGLSLQFSAKERTLFFASMTKPSERSRHYYTTAYSRDVARSGPCLTGYRGTAGQETFRECMLFMRLVSTYNFGT